MRRFNPLVFFLLNATLLCAQEVDPAARDSLRWMTKMGSTIGFDAVGFSVDLLRRERLSGVPVDGDDTLSSSHYLGFLSGELFGITYQGWETGFGLRYGIPLRQTSRPAMMSFGASVFFARGIGLPGRFHLAPRVSVEWMNAQVEADAITYRQNTLSFGLDLALGYRIVDDWRGSDHYLVLGAGVSYSVLRDILLRDGDVYREIHRDDILSLPLYPSFRIGWTARARF